MTKEMNDLLQAVAAEWGQGSQEHNIARDVCKLANKEIEALAAENERLASVATDFASFLIVAENNLSHVSEENERLRGVLEMVLRESVDIECGERILYAGTVNDIRAALEKQP
jgi:hypothetical protein